MKIDIAEEIGNAYPIFAYNATKLSPRDVAATFVPPSAYRDLCDSRNAILVGPRGSGKTTLLKMLTSEALDAWQGPQSDYARQRVSEVGIFVGVDAMWSEQISRVDSESVGSFGAAAYALHVGRAFIRTLMGRRKSVGGVQLERAPHLGIELTREAEIEVANRTSRLFKLKKINPSLRSVYQSLSDQLNELGTYRYRLRDGQILPDWAYLNPLGAVSELAELVNELVGEPDRRWALLFDELELAPVPIVEDILRRLRGNEPFLVFKLSLSPILRSTDLLEGEAGATHGQDVEVIPLTSPSRSDELARHLFNRQREAASIPIGHTPKRVLGDSQFDSGDRGGRAKGRVDPYRRDSDVWKAMHWLKDNDSSFASYLAGSHIDLDALDQLAPEVRAGRIRKIRNIAVVRAHFRRGARIDTQSTRELYAGESTLLALADGNPRMSTILVREILGRVAPGGSLPLSPAAQAAAIEATSARFLALLHAQRGVKFGDRAFSMLELVDAIGRAIHRRVVTDDFSADVAAGFFVDERFPGRYLQLLAQAVNTGAIVHIPKGNTPGPVSQSVLGRHYRLCYLLAPRYGLPLRQGKTVALTQLLQDDVKFGRVPRSERRDSRMSTLPGLEVDDSHV